MKSNPVEYGTCLSFLCIFESVIKTMFLQTDSHSVASPSLLLLQPPPPPHLWATLWCHHTQEVPYKVSQGGGKKLAREGDKQRLLWWELEMADERSCVEKDFLPRNNYSAFSFILLHDSRWALSTTSSAPTTKKKNDTFVSFSFQLHLEQRGISLCGSHTNTMVHLPSDASVSQLVTMNPPPTGRVESSWK